MNRDDFDHIMGVELYGRPCPHCKITRDCEYELADDGRYVWSYVCETCHGYREPYLYQSKEQFEIFSEARLKYSLENGHKVPVTVTLPADVWVNLHALCFRGAVESESVESMALVDVFCEAVRSARGLDRQD